MVNQPNKFRYEQYKQIIQNITNNVSLYLNFFTLTNSLFYFSLVKYVAEFEKNIFRKN